MIDSSHTRQVSLGSSLIHTSVCLKLLAGTAGPEGALSLPLGHSQDKGSGGGTGAPFLYLDIVLSYIGCCTPTGYKYDSKKKKKTHDNYIGARGDW